MWGLCSKIKSGNFYCAINIGCQLFRLVFTEEQELGNTQELLGFRVNPFINVLISKVRITAIEIEGKNVLSIFFTAIRLSKSVKRQKGIN